MTHAENGLNDTYRVLVVEDTQVISKVLQLTLEQAGFAVSVAENGRIAAELLSANDFDFIITDYQMPEMNGEELCRSVRTDERHAGIPILLCTAKGYESTATNLRDEVGLQGIIPKPFSPREVVATVRSILDEQSASV